MIRDFGLLIPVGEAFLGLVGSFDPLQQSVGTLVLKWQDTEQHLVKNSSSTIDFSLLVVWISSENLWSHITGSARVGAEHLPFGESGCKPEINNFNVFSF